MQHKIAIVGFGGMGNWHRETIGQIEELELAGIYDIKEARMEFARECGVYTYESFEAVLADKEVEIILIATPNDLHKPLAIEAMRAGKNVVSEKPVTLTSQDLQEIMDVQEETGMYFTVHQNRRWDEDYLTMEKIYKSGVLGEVHRIESRVQGSRGIPGDWRQEPEHGGGMILDWGVHLLDQALLFMGDTKLNYVYATVTNVTNQIVDDGFSTVLTFENGLEILVEVGTSNFIALPRWYIAGADGTAVIRDWDLSGEIVRAVGTSEKDVVPVRTAAGLTKTMAPRREENIHRESLPIVKSDIHDFYKNVVKVVEKKEESLIKLPEVMRVMKLMEAIFESARERKIVEFER